MISRAIVLPGAARAAVRRNCPTGMKLERLFDAPSATA
jgi:hypothetical protein